MQDGQMLNLTMILYFLIQLGLREMRGKQVPNYVVICETVKIDEDVHDPGSIDLNGSIGILNIGSFKTWSIEITDHNLNAGSDDVITYNPK